ncbi:MAG: hypothetical protein KDB68_14710 [Planctomycetes bacterium]|nr:hypothetical protein [Planctomycetota bacterium]MCA8937446.1 hypothetical protein [Planctomycetota bacterium]
MPFLAPLAAEDFGDWKPVLDEKGESLELTKPIRIGTNVYAQSAKPDANANRAVYCLEQGVAKPVLDDEGIPFVSEAVFEFGGYAFATRRSEADSWRLDGATATRIKTPQGQSRMRFGGTNPVQGADNCPYFVVNNGEGQEKRLYWFSGSEFVEIEVPYLRMPAYVWTGTQFVITSANKTWVIKDAVKTELKDAGGNSCMLIQADSRWEAVGDYLMAEASRVLYRLKDGAFVEIELPDDNFCQQLHAIGNELYLLTRIGLLTEVRPGYGYWKLIDDELEPTALGKKFEDFTKLWVSKVVGDAVLVRASKSTGSSEKDWKLTVNFSLFRDGKATKVDFPKKFKWAEIDAFFKGSKNQRIIVLSLGLGKDMEKSYFTISDTGKLTELPLPGKRAGWVGSNLTPADDGLYLQVANKEKGQATVYLATP